MNSRVLLIGFSFFALSTCLYSSAAPCDAMPLVLSGVNDTISTFGNTENATGYPTSDCKADPYTGVVWYALDVPQGLNVVASTCGKNTEFDTYLGVYQGSSCEDLQCMTGNDDSCPYWLDYFDDDEYLYNYYIPQPSTVGWTSNGETYYIGVSGVYGQSGNFDLKIATYVPDNGCAVAHDIDGPYNEEVIAVVPVNYNNVIGSTACEEVNFFDVGRWFLIHPEPNKLLTITTCSPYTQYESFYYMKVLEGVCGDTECVYNGDFDDCEIANALTVRFTPTQSEYYVIVGTNELDFSSSYIGLTVYQSD